MAEVIVEGSGLGNALTDLLMAPDIVPGDQPSYEICKALWLYHPLGKKMVEGPIAMAQQQPREISIQNSPEDMVRARFVDQWEKDNCDSVIYNFVAISRAYGIATLGVICEEVAPNQPIPPDRLSDLPISYSCFDPLNTAGSLVLNQNPNAIDFMKVTVVAVSGVPYHRSRTITLMNEHPVYISYTSSAFGFVGRSVFQRALFPLKSFIQTMVTDDLVTKKAGVFIATLKAAGAIIDAIMQASAGIKRLFVRTATNGNVISIGPDEKIETLNMQNIDGAFGMARKNILENIATAADMPAIILKQETFAEGFGEGTEDAKMVAGYVSSFRRHIAPAYRFLDGITQRRAWTPEFFKSVQAEYASYRGMRYEDALRQWQESFHAEWPNLLQEPDSEKVKTDKVKLEAICSVLEVLGSWLDPENKATLVEWAQANFNTNKLMFQEPLSLDTDKLATYEPPQPQMGAGGEPGEPKPMALKDSARRRRMRRMDEEELSDLVSLMQDNPAGLRELAGKMNGAGGHA